MKIVQINNLSKVYKINKKENHTFNTSLKRDLYEFLTSPFSFLNKKDLVNIWALKNINLSLEKGETLGIIGSNGSGKSTLLKILSKITSPTAGNFVLNGRTSSLLQLGVGFHADLSGRENIYLNSAILGFSRKEIDSEFNNIVTFSGIDKFIDSPVKYYSSGMYFRLAFSIATAKSLKPDILLLDEVLSVGDVEFSEKCMARMTDLIKNSGTTIIFVSHNLKDIEKLCNKCLWLEKGEIKMIGSSKEVIDKYLKQYSNNK